jgi:hypothetical protein
MCFYLIQVSYGKVKRVRQTENTLLFGYDAQQNRLKKQVTRIVAKRIITFEMRKGMYYRCIEKGF